MTMHPTLVCVFVGIAAVYAGWTGVKYVFGGALVQTPWILNLGLALLAFALTALAWLILGPPCGWQ